MTRVKVSQLEAGPQLRKDAVNTSGRLLLKAGTTIETKHLEIFRTWGVVEVDIVGDELDQDASNIRLSSLPPKIKARIYHQIKQLFRHSNFKHPLIRELITYQKVRLIQEYLQEEQGRA